MFAKIKLLFNASAISLLVQNKPQAHVNLCNLQYYFVSYQFFLVSSLPVTLVSGFDLLLPIFSFLTIVLYDIKHLSYAVSLQSSYEAGIVQSVCHKATGWMVQGSKKNPGRGNRFFCSQKHPNRLWDPPSPIFNAYRHLFLRINRPERELIARLHLAPKLIGEAILILPLYAFMSRGGGVN